MENTAATLKSHMLQYGLLLGGISVIFALMLFFLDMHYTQESAVNWINWGITIVVLVLGIYSYRNSNDGFLTLSEALKLGLGISVISALIAIAYTYAAKEMQLKFSSIGMISTVILIFSLFFGFIVSLITGLILKRNRPE